MKLFFGPKKSIFDLTKLVLQMHPENGLFESKKHFFDITSKKALLI